MEKYWDVKSGKWSAHFYFAAGKFGVELAVKWCKWSEWWKLSWVVGGFKIIFYRREKKR